MYTRFVSWYDRAGDVGRAEMMKRSARTPHLIGSYSCSITLSITYRSQCFRIVSSNCRSADMNARRVDISAMEGMEPWSLDQQERMRLQSSHHPERLSPKSSDGNSHSPDIEASSRCRCFIAEYVIHCGICEHRKGM